MGAFTFVVGRTAECGACLATLRYSWRMQVKPREALHVIDGEAAAGSVKVALRLAGDRVVVNRDPVSIGPTPATRDAARWRATRQTFLAGLCDTEPGSFARVYADYGLGNNLHRLAAGSPVIIWAAAGLHEQLLIAWLVFFGDQAAAPANLHLVLLDSPAANIRVTDIAQLSPEQILAYAPEPRRLLDHELHAYRRAWEAYTSNDPMALVRYLEDEPTHYQVPAPT